MKIYISNDELNGFLNVKHARELFVIPTNSASLIVAPFHFSEWDVSEIGSMVGIIRDRLEYGGTLKLGGYDCIELSKSILRYQIPQDKRGLLMQNLRNLMSLEEVTDILVQAGFKIESRELTGITFMIEAVKC